MAAARRPAIALEQWASFIVFAPHFAVLCIHADDNILEVITQIKPLGMSAPPPRALRSADSRTLPLPAVSTTWSETTAQSRGRPFVGRAQCPKSLFNVLLESSTCQQARDHWQDDKWAPLLWRSTARLQ